MSRRLNFWLFVVILVAAILTSVGIAGKVRYDDRRSRAILTLIGSNLHMTAEKYGADYRLTLDDVVEAMRADGVGRPSPFWIKGAFGEGILFGSGDDGVCLLTYTKRSPGLYLFVVRGSSMHRLSQDEAEALALNRQGTHLHLVR